MLSLRFLILPAILPFIAANVHAADWSQWRGPDRTGHVPAGEKVPATLPAEPKILWRLKIGNGFASPVVARSRVFYSDYQDGQETLHAVEAATGSELWATNIFPSTHDGQSPDGPRCTPLADGDRIYDQSGRGELQCRNAADGALLWRKNYTNDFSASFIGEKGQAQGATRHGNAGSPLIDGGHLIVEVGGTNGESVVCFDKLTGNVIWKSQNDVAAYSAPIIATAAGERQLIVFNADGVMGLSPQDGKFLWRYPVKTDYSRHAMTPVVLGDMVVVSSFQAGLMGIKLTHTGDSWTAERAWLSKECAVNFSSPVAVGDYLYGFGPPRTRDFFCLDIKTGERQWSQTGLVTSNPDRSHAEFMVMGQNILSLTDGGRLILFAADPKEYKQISDVQVCGNTYCNPAYTDGKLYLRDSRELLCVALLP